MKNLFTKRNIILLILFIISILLTINSFYSIKDFENNSLKIQGEIIEIKKESCSTSARYPDPLNICTFPIIKYKYNEKEFQKQFDQRLPQDFKLDGFNKNINIYISTRNPEIAYIGDYNSTLYSNLYFISGISVFLLIALILSLIFSENETIKYKF